MNNMIERFRDMTGKQRLKVVLISALCLIALFYLLADTRQSDDPAPKPVEVKSAPQASVKPSPQPSSEPVPSPSASATPTPTPTTSGKAMPAVEEMVGTLSGEEARIATEAVETAMLEFLRWDEGETTDARMKRLSASVASTSPVRALAPDLEEIATYDADGKAAITSLGAVDYVFEIGGDEKRWRVVVGTVLRWQLTPEVSDDEERYVKERKSNLVVDMTKEDGRWKILDVSNE